MKHILMLSALALPLLASAQPQYRIDLLGTGQVQGAEITGLNDDGVIVGYKDGPVDLSRTNFTASVAKGSTDLPSFNMVSAINNHGLIAGTALVNGQMVIQTYQNGQISYVNTPGYGLGYVLGMNNHGTIAASAWTGSDYHAILVSGGNVVDVGAQYKPHATSWIADVNDNGTAVGAALGAGTFVYENGSVTQLTIPDSAYEQISAINAYGAMVGYAAVGPNNAMRPFVYDKGVLNILQDGPNSYDASAVDINSAGEVIGNWGGQAFLYVNGEMLLLNNLINHATWRISHVFKINDHHQIAATVCSDVGGCQLALLSPVPEPATVAMLLGGLGVVGFATRRRRSAGL